MDYSVVLYEIYDCRFGFASLLKLLSINFEISVKF